MTGNEVLVTIEHQVDGFRTTTNLVRLKRDTFLPENLHNGYFQNLEDAIRAGEVLILTIGELGFSVELYVGSTVEDDVAIREMLNRILVKYPEVVTNRHEFFVKVLPT